MTDGPVALFARYHDPPARDIASSACLLTPVEDHLENLCGQLSKDLAAASTMGEAMKLLRVFKQNTALSIALYDIAGMKPVDAIVQMITRAADCAVKEAVSFLVSTTARGRSPSAREPWRYCRDKWLFHSGHGQAGRI